MREKAIKPLGRKAYGSIPHLPGSKFGDRRDKGLNAGEARLYVEKCKPGERVIVTEKLDGSCVAVARINDEIVSLIRAGYPARSSPWRQHHVFAEWVETNTDTFMRALLNGDHIAGEWLAQAHGTRYAVSLTPPLFSPFAAFDLFINGVRASYDELISVCYRRGSQIAMVPIIYDEYAAVPISAMLDRLGKHGFYCAIDSPEGLVYRRERGGVFVGIAKYVRPEKEPGCYLPEVSGLSEVWNIAQNGDGQKDGGGRK